MKLAIDARLLTAKPSGVRDIAVGIVNGFQQLVVDGELELQLFGVEEANQVETLPARFFMHRELPKAARARGADAIFVPRQTAPFFSSVRSVPLFHDIGFLRSPDVYESNFVRDVTTKWAARKSAVLTVSDFTKTELDAEGLSNHATALPIQAIHRMDWVPSPTSNYVLCVAVQEPHKNLVRLVKAWAKAETGEATLVICGREGADTDNLRRAISESECAPSIRVVSGLSDIEYSNLISGCSAYIQPSLYEGLCIPALDLAAAGAPIGVANLGNLGPSFQVE